MKKGLHNLAVVFLWGACAGGLLCLGSVLLEFAREEMLETRKYPASSEFELWFGALFAFLTALIALAAFVGGLSAAYRGASLLNKHQRREVGDGLLRSVGPSLSREEGTFTPGETSGEKPENQWVREMLRDLPTERHREE